MTASAKAEAPRPTREQIARPRIHRPRPVAAPSDLPEDTVVKTLTSAGVFYLDKTQYMVSGRHGFQKVLVITDGENITVTDLQGELLIEHTRPAPGVGYVGNGRSRGPHTDKPRTSPKS